MTRRDATAPRLLGTERNKVPRRRPAEFWMSMYAAHDLWAERSIRNPIARPSLSRVQRQKFAIYCQMYRKRVRHEQKAHDVLRPMLPGYLFVGIEANLQRWRPIKSTIGVRTVVAATNSVCWMTRLLPA